MLVWFISLGLRWSHIKQQNGEICELINHGMVFWTFLKFPNRLFRQGKSLEFTQNHVKNKKIY